MLSKDSTSSTTKDFMEIDSAKLVHRVTLLDGRIAYKLWRDDKARNDLTNSKSKKEERMEAIPLALEKLEDLPKSP